MWALLWTRCFLCEFKTKAEAHRASLVGWFLPVAWLLLGICWLWGLGQLYPEASPSLLVPSISPDLAHVFLSPLYPVLAGS